MRKDRLSSFQAKKQKLLKIKEIIIDLRLDTLSYYEEELTQKSPLYKIWELVKDE